MSEWQEAAVGELCTMASGKGRAHDPAGAYPLFGSNGVIGASVEPLAVAGIVVGRVGAYCGSVLMASRPFWATDNTIVVRPTEAVNLGFLFAALSNAQLPALAGGAAQPLINQGRLKALRITVPDRPTQDRIAACLAAFEELIEINERRIELLEDLARSLYREWFVRFRFPGHKDVAVVDSELGPIPDGWAMRELADVAIVNQRTLKRSELPDPLLYLDISAVGVGRIEQPESLDAADAPGRARRALADGDVVWATVRPNRRAHGLVYDPPEAMVASTGLAVLTPSGVSPSYLFNVSSEPAFTDYLVSRATGSAYPAVRPPDFDEYPIVVPDPVTARAFDRLTEPALRTANALIAHNRRLAATRDLLLPRLVTGRIDISDVDLGGLLPAEAA